MAAFLSKDDILAAQDLKTEEVHVPEWNGTVLIRGLTATERDAYEASMFHKGSDELNLKNARARLLVMTLVDEKGECLFSKDEIKALGRKNGAVLDRLWRKARKLSGLTREDVDELVGNSSGAPGGASS